MNGLERKRSKAKNRAKADGGSHDRESQKVGFRQVRREEKERSEGGSARRRKGDYSTLSMSRATSNGNITIGAMRDLSIGLGNSGSCSLKP